MSFSSWLRNWKRSLERRSSQKSTQRRKPSTRRVASRLFLEALEARTVLSPVLTVDQYAVSGSNGAVVSNTGMVSDTTAGATVTLTASAGTIQQSNGTWSWSETTPSGAAQTGPVEIYATDSQGATTTIDFWLNVGQVFTVTNTGDNNGVNPAPGVGTGTLRQAIIDANNVPAGSLPSLIDFNIPTSDPGYSSTTGAFTITPQSVLPAIGNLNNPTSATIIDGYTQSGASENVFTNGDNAVLKIVLDGAQVPGGDEFTTVGLAIAANNSTVQGLAINSFGGSNIYVTGSSDTIQGNFIGTDVSGNVTPFTPNLAQLGASDHVGIHISGGSDNIIGTNGDGVNDAAERNVIAGNNYGVLLRTTTDSVVAGNFIGTDSSGTKALPNWIGIGTLAGANGDRIGTNGTDPDVAGETNIISGNAGGIAFGVGNPAPAERNGQVYGNSIGVDVNGSSLGNTRGGIFVGVGSEDISIGGSQANLANTIANTTTGSGVWIVNFRGTPTGIRVQGNSIYGNGGLGIDLGGSYPTPPTSVLLNDSQGHANEPNNFQDFPSLSSAVSSTTDTSITGSFSEADEANTPITLDFYSNSTADSSGYGQGQTYLGSTTVTTDNSGNASFSVDFGTGNLAEQWITATATAKIYDNTTNTYHYDTSEFAQDIQATAAPSGQSYNNTYLQTLLPQSSSTSNQLTIQTGPNLSQATVISAVNGLTAPANPVTIALNLNGGTNKDTTVNPPANVTLIINGANGTSNTFVGQSPAFTVTGGNVIVENVTFTTATDAPTILVTGGSLTLRNDDVENTGNAQADISLTGGSLDIGTTTDPGDNLFDINGTGAWFQNTTSNPLVSFSNTFEINGVLQPATTPTISVTDGGTYNGSAFSATATVAGLNGLASSSLQGVGLVLDYQQLDSQGNVIKDLGAAAPMAAGTYQVTASYAGSPNYLSASKSATFTIVQAVPTFSLVASPTVIDGTATTKITGAIAAGSVIPPSTENVTITVNGTSYVAAINPDGTFAMTVPTASLGMGAYTIIYSYAGDNNFTSASATANMDVTNGVLSLFNQSQAKNAGSTIPIQIELVSAGGQDLSSAGTTVTAVGMAATTDTTDTVGSIDPSLVGTLQPVQAAGNSNPNNVFREQDSSKPFYMYNLQTPTGLTAGTYRLYFQVQGDPLWHWVTFSVS